MTYRLAAVLAVLLVGACSSHPPTAQLQSFSDAYKAANDAGQPLLDDLAVAEKAQGQDLAKARAQAAPSSAGSPDPEVAGCASSTVSWANTGKNTGFIQGYCLADAPYFSTLGDPPATQAFRGGLAILGKYVDVLTGLAEGRNVEELQGQLQGLSTNIGQLLVLVPGAAVAGPAIDGALRALKPVIDAAARQSNVEEIRAEVLKGAPAARNLIEELKNATPAMFDTLTEAAADKITQPPALGNPEIVQPEIARIEAYRVTVSNFVVLLNGLESALDKLVVAVESPDDAATLQSLTDETANLRIYADAVRNAFAAVRHGG